MAKPAVNSELQQEQSTPFDYFLSAFLAMEPSDVLISFARDCGGGSITESVQSFIWRHCVSKTDVKLQGPFLKKFLKKLILEIESNGGVVLDELYEQYVGCMTWLKDEDLAKGNSRVLKTLTFLSPDGWSRVSGCSKHWRLEVPLQCSLNMLEGDTGCSIWPSSLFLSEFILSFPEIFANKCCFEIGSGVGLVGICLAHVKASKVILSDGDLSTLANMKLNLELNHLIQIQVSDSSPCCSKVRCIHLPWESASEEELLQFRPDIILGADVIYDPTCLPHLVKVFAILLKCETSHSNHWSNGPEENPPDEQLIRSQVCAANVESNAPKATRYLASSAKFSPPSQAKGPVAYIASVIRNIDTFNYFLSLTEQANLIVTDITEIVKPFHFLPYLRSYPRSSIRLYNISYLSK